MSEERLARLLRTLHSLATRVPKIVLRRAEDIFPTLHTSMRVCVAEDAEVTSRHQTVRMSDPQNNCVNPEERVSDVQYPCDIDNNSVTEDTCARKRRTKCSYMCDVCKKPFTWQSVLKVHLRVHTGERPFSCDLCEKRFTQRSQLNRHLREHTEVLKRVLQIHTFCRWPLMSLRNKTASVQWRCVSVTIVVVQQHKLSKENSSTSSRPSVETKVTHPRRQVGFYRMMSSMASSRTYQNFAVAILRSWRYAPARVEGTVESSRAYDVDRASTASARSQSAKNGVHSSQPARLLDGW